MAFFANYLSNMLGRTVVDKTGLAGEFPIRLTFTPESSVVPSPDAAAPCSATSTMDTIEMEARA